MYCVKKLFPHAMCAKDLIGFLIAILVYAVLSSVGGFVCGCFNEIPLIGFLFDVLGWIVKVYCTVGIMLSLLVVCKIVK